MENPDEMFCPYGRYCFSLVFLAYVRSCTITVEAPRCTVALRTLTPAWHECGWDIRVAESPSMTIACQVTSAPDVLPWGQGQLHFPILSLNI
jgi:hypothetical protein